MDIRSSCVRAADRAEDGRETESRADEGAKMLLLLGEPNDHRAITLAILFPGPWRSRGKSESGGFVSLLSQEVCERTLETELVSTHH